MIDENPAITLTHHDDGRVRAVSVDGRQWEPQQIKAAPIWAPRWKRLAREYRVLWRNMRGERDSQREELDRLLVIVPRLWAIAKAAERYQKRPYGVENPKLRAELDEALASLRSPRRGKGEV